MRLKLLLVAALAATALAVSQPAAAWHDYFQPWTYTTPIAYRCWDISQWYGPATYSHRYGENSMAVDIATWAGTPVYAPKAGTVISEGWEPVGGIVIRIQHKDSWYNSGVQTILAHLNSSVVNDGQWVSQNQFLGYSGTTGGDPPHYGAVDPHLHWAMYEPASRQGVPPDDVPGVENVYSGPITWAHQPYPYTYFGRICP
jgi:murein DD-endopeptidase MepM/ murein hydrolase activator NlpD